MPKDTQGSSSFSQLREAIEKNLYPKDQDEKGKKDRKNKKGKKGKDK